MRVSHLFQAVLIGLWCFVAQTQALADERLPELTQMHPKLIAGHTDLSKKRQTLVIERKLLFARHKKFRAACISVEAGTDADRRCAAEDSALDDALAEHYEACVGWLEAYDELYDELLRADILAYARKHRWTSQDLAGLRKGMDAWQSYDQPHVGKEQAAAIWQNIAERKGDKQLRREAAAVKGFSTTGAGTQSFNDCALFAIANAAGVPYGAVAALATKFMSDGTWRLPDERADPQSAIEKKGLNGGEVLMLIEYYGRARVLPPSEFKPVLSAGRPILINVRPPSGSAFIGHQIVLTKSFRSDTTDWYEAMDSNDSAIGKLYLKADELNTLILETGIAYFPDDRRGVTR